MPLWGDVKIKEEELDLEIVEDYSHPGETFKAIYVGFMDGFPLSDSSVYYCYDDDTIYYYPTESYYTGPPTPYKFVYRFRPFKMMVDEFR